VRTESQLPPAKYRTKPGKLSYSERIAYAARFPQPRS
jgi:hypothetical protein